MEAAIDGNTSLRVASFSSYLETGKDNLARKISAQPFSNFSCSKDTAGEKFVFNIPAATMQDPTPVFTFPQETKKNGETSIFGADKYFTMKLDYSKNKGPGNPTTPSLCSEASSWNSQNALLPILQTHTKPKKAIRRRIFPGFACQGPCFDKKGIHISTFVAHGSSKPTRTGSGRIDRLAIVPVPNPGPEKIAVANLEESRTSIEVFGSGTMLKGDVAENMERKLSMLTWDAIPISQNHPTSKSGTISDDMLSDASSDLFEIEHLLGSINPLLTMSPSSNYAPSEASIQWSVVTASAADYSASDHNDESESVAGDVKNNLKTRDKGIKGAQKGRPGGLLGCKSHKAVDVAENVRHKSNEKAKNQGLDLSVSLGKKSQVTSKGAGVERY